ncbi:hypothetical protein Cgig2_003915 [Carnegiea gigantea]|uniref:Uncharacterized protein n=1 Tax=Carnegiea gigantea TaxID=171969 RepID=A0A9Q1KAC6_9CARY|nr:hypothetical protein Cgig2_003915 [Carnegiea gigantea]
MNAQHHASLGRRTLEEIRQKRAAEKLNKASSGSDLSTTSNPPDYGGIKRSESISRLSENDIGSLVAQLKDLQKKNTDLEEQNKRLNSKLEAKEVECETLQSRLNDLEQSTVPSLRKALRDVAMEKDAAVVAREDLSAQLRTLKKRLKEAEEEQYRRESKLRQQEQQLLAQEQAQLSALMSEKQELELKLVDLTKGTSEHPAERTSQKPFSMQDKEKLESQLHDMAIMVERLESGRQKLLAEIDSQSSEIERLFEENSNLTSAYQESMSVVSHWENQVKECLKQNEELRGMLDKLRTEQISIMPSNGGKMSDGSFEANTSGKSETSAVDYTNEVLNLKVQLAREQTRAEGLAAEVMQLSLQVQQATRAYAGLARLYKPVLRNIESSLVKIKHDGSIPVRL